MLAAHATTEDTMALDSNFIASLVCPETREKLDIADPALIDQLNSAVKAGTLKNRGGQSVSTALDGGLVRADGRVVYPIWDDIPNLLVDEGIDLSGA